MEEANASRSHSCLEQYKLRKQLHQGSTSRVCEAVDRRTGQHVALKIYHKGLMHELQRSQLERELSIHRSLAHRNIVQLVEVFEDERAVYMAEAFSGGGGLVDALARLDTGRFSEDRTAGTVMVPLLQAVEYIHAKGIIHRDVKTENLLLDSDGTLKLADFRLAIDCAAARPGSRVGTWEYMAPEAHLYQFRRDDADVHGPETYLSAVDIWACGILAYELLVGRPPFSADDGEVSYESAVAMAAKLQLPAWLSHRARSFIRSALCTQRRARTQCSTPASHGR